MGVVSEMRSGALFIEEVAHDPAIQVLNGCLYGLFGLYEYVRVFDDAELRPVLAKCVRGVEEALPLFDMGWWSRYSLGLRWHMAPPYYHDVHIRQLEELAVRLERPDFDVYARRWDAYRQSAALGRRRAVQSFIEVNVNRALTVAAHDRFKYRRVEGFGS